MNIMCTSITEKGSNALKKCIEDNKDAMGKLPKHEVKEFKNTWKEIITYTPLCRYTLLLRARSVLGASYYITKKFIKGVNSAKEFNENIQPEFEKMAREIDEAMKKEGAIPNIDYIMGVNQ